MNISKKAQLCDLSPIRKFHPYACQAVAEGKEIIHLNIGQPDIPTQESFFETLRKAHFEVLEYAPSPGVPAMVEAYQSYYRRIGVNFDQDDILVTTGGSEALQILMLCILDEGDEVLTAEPFYPNYNTMVRAAGGVIRPIPTTPEEGYRFADRARIEACITEKTRAIIVTNPGNPTGVVLSHEEMALLKDIAKEHDLYLVGDEVYREFIYEGQSTPVSFAQFTDADENIVIVDSVSKRFSACGARIGALLTKNKAVIENALKFCQARLSVATLDQIGAAAMYQSDESYFAAIRAEYQARRDTCYKGLMEIPGVVCVKPEGAFYMMAKLPVDDTEKFQIWLLQTFQDRSQTIMFAPGSGFYATEDAGKDEIRIAYVLKQERLQRAMELLKLAIEQYRRDVMKV